MKKLALLITSLLLTSQAFAYIQEYTTSDAKTLQGTGMSQEAIKIIDTARMINQGSQKDYVPFFSRKITPEGRKEKWYHVAKIYFDPEQDENVFGVREITFHNEWFPMSPSYSSKMTPNDKYFRLLDKDAARLETAGKTIKGSNGVEVLPAKYRYSDSEVKRAIENL